MQPIKWMLHAGTRLRKIAAFGRAGLKTRDKLKMTVIGYARGHTFGAPGLISRVGRKLFPTIAVRPELFGGLVLHIDPSDLSQLAVAEEILLEQVYDLSRVPFSPDIILDCGAYTGLFTLLAASQFPKSKLICFEPDPGNYLWLEKQVQSNLLTVELIQACVSTLDGEALFKAGQGCGSALSNDAATSSDAIMVRILDLSRYIAVLDCERLLLKLDVEGAEEELLPSLVKVLPQDCSVFLETHGGKESWEEASRLLQAHGFSTRVTRRRQIYTDGFAVRRSEAKRASE
jgi:FkbM family methyltransferase